MESQRVRLLVNGYLNGWLTFKYTQSLSRYREELILLEMERKMFQEVYFLRTIKEAAVTGGLVTLNPKLHDIPDKSYEGFIRSLLPSLAASHTIKQELTPDKIEYWKKFLNEKNKAFKDEIKVKELKK